MSLGLAAAASGGVIVGDGGWILVRAVDHGVAVVNRTLGSREWTNDDRVAEKLELYATVAGPMRQSARKGLWNTLRRRPLEHDVEDVLVAAFEELWEMDRTEVRSERAMGCSVAYRRGQDRGMRNRRELRQVRPTDALDSREDLADEPVDELHHALRLAILAECKQLLTADQRAVIAATVEGHFGEEPMKLAEWARLKQHRGVKTYEAWRRQLKRGIESLRRCLERREAEGGASGV